MANNDEITGLPSACHQSTQTEDALDVNKKTLEDGIFEEQGRTLSTKSQNETEV